MTSVQSVLKNEERAKCVEDRAVSILGGDECSAPVRVGFVARSRDAELDPVRRNQWQRTVVRLQVHVSTALLVLLPTQTQSMHWCGGGGLHRTLGTGGDVKC